MNKISKKETPYDLGFKHGAEAEAKNKWYMPLWFPDDYTDAEVEEYKSGYKAAREPTRLVLGGS